MVWGGLGLWFLVMGVIISAGTTRLPVPPGFIITTYRLQRPPSGPPWPANRHSRSPPSPTRQLRLAVQAVFWRSRRAHDYRVASTIPHDLGTAANVITMVFGNMGDDGGTPCPG